MQRVSNYGSFLQAYGLKSLVESLGHTVTFIDYRCGKPVVPYSGKARAWMLVKMHVPILAKAVDYARYYFLGRTDFNIEYRVRFLPQLGVSYRYKFDERVDVAVVGSDEVFNCLQTGENVGLSPMLFGQGINAEKVVSYAASCGYTDLGGLERHGLTEKVGAYLKSFAALSARDGNTRQVIRSLTGSEPEMHLDPVLVSDFPLPEPPSRLRDYIILYTYPSRHYSEKEREEIKDFCRRNGKRLVSIGPAQPWVEQKIPASPLELLAYIKGADFVITDTFHGTVFSIKYNRNFAVRVREDNRQKLGDLLGRLGMGSRRVADFSQLQGMYESAPDYQKTNGIIRREKERTMDYLRGNLC